MVARSPLLYFLVAAPTLFQIIKLIFLATTSVSFALTQQSNALLELKFKTSLLYSSSKISSAILSIVFIRFICKSPSPATSVEKSNSSGLDLRIPEAKQ